jgi:hypothetical protein
LISPASPAINAEEPIGFISAARIFVVKRL